mmetsp:Transcript_3250/g.8644  ORF Transcript_3250/g.8644 Transcript_3250/m.8644 type:complete len:286 (+) Transcript_3250:281-1138(+)
MAACTSPRAFTTDRCNKSCGTRRMLCASCRWCKSLAMSTTGSGAAAAAAASCCGGSPKCSSSHSTLSCSCSPKHCSALAACHRWKPSRCNCWNTCSTLWPTSASMQPCSSDAALLPLPCRGCVPSAGAPPAAAPEALLLGPAGAVSRSDSAMLAVSEGVFWSTPSSKHVDFFFFLSARFRFFRCALLSLSAAACVSASPQSSSSPSGKEGSSDCSEVSVPRSECGGRCGWCGCCSGCCCCCWCCCCGCAAEVAAAGSAGAAGGVNGDGGGGWGVGDAAAADAEEA